MGKRKVYISLIYDKRRGTENKVRIINTRKKKLGKRKILCIGTEVVMKSLKLKRNQEWGNKVYKFCFLIKNILILSLYLENKWEV